MDDGVLECVRGPRVADGTCGPRPRKEPRVATRKRACTRPRINCTAPAGMIRGETSYFD